MLDCRLHTAALEVMREGLELAHGKDDTAPGRCLDCGSKDAAAAGGEGAGGDGAGERAGGDGSAAVP